jgi:NADH dehydrogenase FAD-containing subunit
MVVQGDIKITVVDTMDHLLGAFERQLSEYTQKHLLKEGIRVQLGTM